MFTWLCALSCFCLRLRAEVRLPPPLPFNACISAFRIFAETAQALVTKQHDNTSAKLFVTWHSLGLNVPGPAATARRWYAQLGYARGGGMRSWGMRSYARRWYARGLFASHIFPRHKGYLKKSAKAYVFSPHQMASATTISHES